MELYDLQTDRCEYKNVAAQNPKLLNKLLDELIDWHGTVKAPTPTEKNPQYKPGAKKEKKEIEKGRRAKNKRF